MIDTLWSDWCEVRVLLGIGASGGPDQTFTLDDATYGQLDYALLGSPLAPYEDVTCDVRALEWQFGATRTDGVLTRWEAGSAVVTLGNNSGAYDVGGDSSRLRPMIPVRIDARLVQPAVGAWVTQFTGYADTYAAGFDAALDCTVTVTATDATLLLAAYALLPTSPLVGAGEDAAHRVNRILDAAEWSGARNVAPGGRVLAATDLSGDAWTQLVAVNDAELGAVYVAPSGAVTFITRETLFGKLSSTDVAAVTFGPDAGDARYEDVTIAVDDALLRNIVDAQRPGGALQTARNNDSVAQFLPHRSGNTALVLATDADCAAWASLIVNTSGTPFPRVDALTVWPRTQPGALWPVAVNTSYLDRWHVKVQPPGTIGTDIDRDVLVRGWHTSVTREDWQTIYALSSITGFEPFVLDDPDTLLDVIRLTA